MADWDAVVVGAGPNGLAAACRLARSGAKVLLLESSPTVGGGCRTAELVLPDHRSDICAAVHPFGVMSPAFSSMPLADHGLEWLEPAISAAHPFDDGTAAVLTRSLDETAAGLGSDADAYRDVVGGIDRKMFDIALSPPLRGVRTPISALRFAAIGMRSSKAIADRFDTREARGLLAGMAAHGLVPLERSPTAGIALLLLAAAHLEGWPLVAGGSQRLADALAAYFVSLGGEIGTSHHVAGPRDLPAAKTVLFDVAPEALAASFGAELPPGYATRARSWRRGPAVFKVDWVLEGPVPWRDPDSPRAGTVHVGGTWEEIAASERAVADGVMPERPFVLVAQPSVVDPTRAPAGRHVVWGYCHVPAGHRDDATSLIERQIERYAPGFIDRIVARHTMGPDDLERYNPNYVGGDIGGGLLSLGEILRRSVRVGDPYRIPGTSWFLCSASTPPGPGVHGMCGHHAAGAALQVLGTD